MVSTMGNRGKVVSVVKHNMGEHAAERMELMMAMEDGWGEKNKGKSLSSESLAKCMKFVDSFDFSYTRMATVFMEHSGDLSLSWQCGLEMNPYTVEVFFHSDGDVEVCAHDSDDGFDFDGTYMVSDDELYTTLHSFEDRS